MNIEAEVIVEIRNTHFVNFEVAENANVELIKEMANQLASAGAYYDLKCYVHDGIRVKFEVVQDEQD